MILLRQLLIDCEIPQSEFGSLIRAGKDTVTNALVHSKMPVSDQGRVRFVSAAEAWVRQSPAAMGWLRDNGMAVPDIWNDYDGIWNEHRGRAFIPVRLGDPLKLEKRKDIVMISLGAQKHFKLFKNPFLNDVAGERDIFLSAEHRFLKTMMLDSARFGGFIAVVGGVGSGKSVMRKSVAGQLAGDGIKVVFPLIIDKSRITPSSLIDAIIMDISDETPRRSLEQKTRQAVKLLKARAENGLRQVLIIEEAHTIDKRAFKALKQIYELETGFEKLIGIILIGQPELLKKLDEIGNSDIREVIRRITTAEIEGLGDAVKPYLEHKFRRVGKKAGEILADDAYDAINRKLERMSGRKKVNRSFPLSVNNLVARAMNTAARMGESRITADLILSC